MDYGLLGTYLEVAVLTGTLCVYRYREGLRSACSIFCCTLIIVYNTSFFCTSRAVSCLKYSAFI